MNHLIYTVMLIFSNTFSNSEASPGKYEAPSIDMLQVSSEQGFADSVQQFDIDPYGDGITF